MHTHWNILPAGALVAALLAGCATRETVPVVHVAANSSGIVMDAPHPHGPVNLISGRDGRPDVPAGVDAKTHNTRPARPKASRPFVPTTGELRIVSLERADRYYEIHKALPYWQSLASGDWAHPEEVRRVLYHQQPDPIPRINAGADLHAKLHARTFSWGRAVLFIAEYSNANTGLEIGDDQLYLTVQGFTNDGRYAVNGYFQITGPDRRHFPRKRFLGRKAKTGADYEADNDLVADWLTRQPDDAYDPTIRQYEKFLDALRIEPPGR